MKDTHIQGIYAYLSDSKMLISTATALFGEIKSVGEQVHKYQSN